MSLHAWFSYPVTVGVDTFCVRTRRKHTFLEVELGCPFKGQQSASLRRSYSEPSGSKAWALAERDDLVKSMASTVDMLQESGSTNLACNGRSQRRKLRPCKGKRLRIKKQQLRMLQEEFDHEGSSDAAHSRGSSYCPVNPEVVNGATSRTGQVEIHNTTAPIRAPSGFVKDETASKTNHVPPFAAASDEIGSESEARSADSVSNPLASCQDTACDATALLESSIHQSTKRSRQRPCKGKRERLQKFTALLVEQARLDPAGFSTRDISWPRSVAGDAVLTQKILSVVFAHVPEANADSFATDSLDFAGTDRKRDGPGAGLTGSVTCLRAHEFHRNVPRRTHCDFTTTGSPLLSAKSCAFSSLNKELVLQPFAPDYETQAFANADHGWPNNSMSRRRPR